MFCNFGINKQDSKMKRFASIILSLFLVTTSFHLKKATHNHSNNDSIQLPKVLPITIRNSAVNSEISTVDKMYGEVAFDSANLLRKDIFSKAYQGFENLKKAGKLSPDAHLLSICDFSLSSNKKRLWVIDLESKKVVYNSLVAHGSGTGEEFAEYFSNTESSHQSSLGFYITENTYQGKNGYSLRLIGMDKGYNDAAWSRAIVMHGADYVSEDFAKQHKRIGRSWGCPAVPKELAPEIINTIKENTCLFIYYPDETYLQSSEWLKS